jgi:hypothetical protein
MKLLSPRSAHSPSTSMARPARLLGLAFLAGIVGAITIAIPLRGRQAVAVNGLTAHEWGTFTAIAGADGQPVDWLPVDLVGMTPAALASKPELPTFIEHFRGAPKSTLHGTVRMETPVIYFYSPQQTTISVHVSFSNGFITEWYPHATRVEPSTPLASDALYQPHGDGSIAWDSISVAPYSSTDFPHEIATSRYYAARDTSATPLSVESPIGEQHEKFLFYRGVSTFALPLAAKVLPSGSILFNNLAGQPIPSLIVLERRGDRLGYHIATAVSDHAILETPSVSGTLDSLRSDLEDILIAQGLFRDEARAMLATWGDSWFEEGSRLIYIVPRQYVDSILPLTISPAPIQLARVFVGRIELVTPATENSVQAAIASHDGAALRKYGRFLYPIVNIILAKHSDPSAEDHLWEELEVSLAAGSPTAP